MVNSKVRFTKLALKQLEPQEKVYRVFDSDMPCHALAVYPTGTKKFLFQKKVGSQTKRKTLGTFPELPLEKSRMLALKELEKALTEESEPKTKYKDMAFNELIDIYMNDFKAAVRQGHKRQKSYDDFESTWRVHLQKTSLAKTKIHELSFEQARDVLNKIKAKAPNTYNKCLTLCKAAYNKAKQERFIEVNPFETLKKSPGLKRDRYLKSYEMKAFFESLKNEDQDYQDIILCLLFTGQRKNCVFSMEWEEIDFERGHWTIPSSKFKSKRIHTVPLPSTVYDILKRRNKERTSPRYVFPAKKNGVLTHMTDTLSPWRRVTTRAGLYSDDKTKRLTIHDLRRTFASWQAMQNESLLSISKILGHSDTRVTSEVYAHLQIDKMKTGMDTTIEAIQQSAGVSND